MTKFPHLFFSYSSAGGFDVHKTLEDAKACAQAALDGEQEDAGSDGWDEDAALSICYGSIAGGVEEVGRIPWAEHMRNQGYDEEDCAGSHQFDEFVDFKIEEYGANGPAAAGKEDAERG